MSLKDKIKKYMKAASENKMQIAQLAIMGAIAVNSGDHHVFATVSGGDMGSFSFLAKPVTQIANVVTGPLAVAVTGLGTAMLGYGIISDNQNTQIVKKGGGLVTAVGCTAGGIKVIDSMASGLGTSMGTGFLF